MLMMVFISTQDWAKGMVPSTDHEGGQTEAVVAEPPKASPPPTVDGADRLYCSLAEIHAIAAMQLAECARWRRSNPTSNATHAGAGW
jgi:hypothetical protein